MFDFTDTDLFKGIASLVTGGAFVGWYRENRKSKKDKQDFTLEFMREQSGRIDKLVEEVAALKAENKIWSGELEAARLEKARLEAKLVLKNAEVVECQHEIVRLKTALGEHGRNNA